MKLFSFLSRDCEDLLPAWLAHYHRLGVTDFRLILHGSASDRAWLERYRSRYPVQIVDSLEGIFDEHLKCKHLTDAIRVCPGEWIMFVDSDEFLEFPYRSLRRTIKMLELLGAESLYAPMLQRMSLEGRLERVKTESDIEKLFPLGSTHLCERICSPPPFAQKYPLFLNRIDSRIRSGGHFPPTGVATDELPIRGVTHHFKWRHAMLAGIEERSHLANANAGEISAYYAYLQTHRMQLPLDGAFHYSRKKLFELGLLRRPEKQGLCRCLMLRELRNVPLDASGTSAERARRFARQLRSRRDDSTITSDSPVGGFPASPGDLVSPPLKICMATWELMGVRGSGGIGTSMAALAELLASAGHDVTIFYQPTPWQESAPQQLVEAYADRGIKVIQQRVNENSIAGSVWAILSHSAYRWLAERDFDVIHFPECAGMGQYTARAKHQGLDFQNTIICVTMHGFTEWGRLTNQNPLLPSDSDCAFMESESARLADAVISPSQFMLDTAKAHAFEFPAATFVHPNILRPSCRRLEWSAGADSSSASNLKEAVFIGRLEERKGVVMFCDALDRLAAGGRVPSGFSVSFLGRCEHIRGMPSETYIAQRAANWHFPFKIESSFTMPRAVEYLSQQGCFGVIPSIEDNYPNTILECLGADIPFVALDSGGVPEIIHPADRQRVLVEPGVANLAGRLESALVNGLPIARPAWHFDEIDLRWLEWHGALKKPRPPECMPVQPELPDITVCLTSDGTHPEALKKAAEALFSQTHGRINAILATGGFPDSEMEKVLSEIEPRFQSAGWQHFRVPGACHAALMQRAATAANASFLLFLKDIQVPESTMAETLLQVAVKTGASVVTCGFSRPGTAGGEASMIEVPTGGDLSLCALRNCFGSHHFLVRRTTFFELGGMEAYPAPEGNESWQFFLRTLIAGYRVEVVPRELVLDLFEPEPVNPDLLLKPFLQSIPRETRPLALLAHQALKPLWDHSVLAPANSRSGGLSGMHLHSSTVRYNGIAEIGIEAVFGSGWHHNEREGRWTGANGSLSEIIFFSPDSLRFINFKARVQFAKHENSLEVALNNQPLSSGVGEGWMRLKGLHLHAGKNTLTFTASLPPEPWGMGDRRMLGAFFSEIEMDVSNRFGSEALELSQWFAKQSSFLPPGSQLCVRNASHRAHGYEAWFGSGWHRNELTHRWAGADGQRNTIEIFSPKENGRITFEANLEPLRRGDRLGVFLNDKPVLTVRSERRIRLPNLMLHKGLNVIALESKLPPVQLNGRDSRCLSWMIHDLEIIPDA